MGQNLFEAYDKVKEIFALAEAISRRPIKQLCFEGSLEELTATVNLQPAVTAVNLACLVALQKSTPAPMICAGHSLGEYSALCAAGVISLEDCLKLVFKRGQLMQREAMRHKGVMSAVVGLPIEQMTHITSTCAQAGIVTVANHNSVAQIVISGEPAAVQAAATKAREHGARIKPLKVSGAWHSPLIKGAEAEFYTYLESIAFHPPTCEVYHNVTAAPASDPLLIKSLMARQLCSPVRWYDAMLKMIQARIEVFVEIGPGKVLTGLLKKILPTDYPCSIYNVYDIKSLEKFINFTLQ